MATHLIQSLKKKKKGFHVCNSLTLIYYTLSIVIVYIVVTKNKLWRTNASVFFFH